MASLPVLTTGLALLLAMQATPEHHGAAGEGEGHDHAAMSLPEYIARMEDPARAEWQKPADVVKALGLEAGDRVLDLGAGPGYFSIPIARAVGAKGHVFAADVEPGMLAALLERAGRAGVRNITPVLVPADDPSLPEASVDLAFVCDTYHHIEDRGAYLAKLRRILRPGGRLVIVDFQKRETPVGPPLSMRVDRGEVVKECAAAGFSLASEMAFLPHQYGLVFRR